MPFLSTVHIVVPVNNRGIMLRVSISILVRKGAPGQRFIVCHVSVTMAQTNQIDRRTLRDSAISHVLLTVGPELALPALYQLIRAKFPPKGWYLQSRMAEAWVKVSVVFFEFKRFVFDNTVKRTKNPKLFVQLSSGVYTAIWTNCDKIWILKDNNYVHKKIEAKVKTKQWSPLNLTH